MSTIQSVRARQVFDSRGNPTVEAELTTKDGVFASIVPSGASTGVHEALELRDKGKAFHGKGVDKAVANVNKKIAKKVKGMKVTQQEKIDQAMLDLDKTENKSNLGANAILSVSMAAARAGAAAKGIPLYQHLANLARNKKLILPVPSMNVINGGAHAGNKLDIQEYMMLPTGAKNFAQAMQIGSEVYQQLKKVIKKKYGPDAINVGDEGGFAPPLATMEEPIKLVMKAVGDMGYSKKVVMGLDSAASGFYQNGKYLLEGKKLSGAQLAARYQQVAKKYPIAIYEDPFDEEDFASFALLNQKIGDKIQIVGDDLLVTNVNRIKTGIEMKSCNALLLKVNQIGTVTESIAAANLAQKAGWGVMVSHRSGETEDSFIADLVVGLGVGQIKSGAPCRSERLAKYNQLLRIEEKLGKKAKYAGKKFRRPK